VAGDQDTFLPSYGTLVAHCHAGDRFALSFDLR
jgi:hypothetical protein